MRIEGLSIIYRITNPNGKIYIGQSEDWVKRMRDYKFNRASQQKLIYRSIKKYGWENHRVELIEYFPKNEIDSGEIHYISKYNCYYKDNPNGLNMTRGGKTLMKGIKGIENPLFGRKKSEETKNKMRVYRIGKVASDETKLKQRIAKLGTTQSNESKQRRSEATSVPIIQYSLGGEFIKVWRGSNVASKNLKISQSHISDCLLKKKHRTHTHGFQWRKYTENYPLKIEAITLKRALKKYETFRN